MTNTRIDSFRDIRSRAEEKARVDEEMILETLTLDDARQLFHELRVYQIELEMQNEEMRSTQRQLEESRSRYVALYDLAPVGYLTLNDQGLILNANLAAADMLHATRTDLLNKPMTQLIHRDDQDVYYLNRKQTIETGEFRVWEMRMVRGDGTPFWARLQATPAFNDEYWITLNDISRRKKLEEELKENNQFINTVLMSANDGIIVVDRSGKILLWNSTAERTFGTSADEMYNPTSASSDWKLYREDGSLLSDAEFPSTRTFATGEACLNTILKVERAGGEFSWINVNTSPIFKANESVPASVVITFSDITERKQAVIESELSADRLRQAKEAAEAANIAKSDFLATMSHEIRTPLGAMLGNVELLEGSPLTPQQQEYLNDCKSAAQILLQVINDVLDFSKIEAGKLDLVHETFSVSSMSRQLVRIFSATAQQKGLDLTLSLADDLPACINADQQRLRQIISNLLNNAIKFTNLGTVSLEIACEQTASEACPDEVVLRIVVRDTGIGVPTDKQEHIFESFTQVERFGTRTTSGTGLGLPICRRLLTLMGGSITVSSVSGEGSAFTVILPVTRIRAENQVQDQVQAQEQLQVPSRKILLADDDKWGRLVAQKLLQRRGYQVTAVENGAQLLDELQKAAYEIVLTDISMPDMEGTQVARIIRSGERDGIDPRIPIIAMTAHAFTEDREHFLASGIDGYVAKPVIIEELFRQIEELCSRNRD